MASEVNRQSISAEGLLTLLGRYNRNARLHARLLRRDFLSLCQPPGCTKQLFRVKAAWPFASAWQLRALRSAPKKLMRAPCRPFKSGEVVLLPAALVLSRFGMRAASWRAPLRPVPFCCKPRACRGPIKVSRSGAVTQPDTSRSSRSQCCLSGHGVRPWLPQLGLSAPRHARLARHGAFMVVSFLGLLATGQLPTRGPLGPGGDTAPAQQGTTAGRLPESTDPGHCLLPGRQSNARCCDPDALRKSGCVVKTTHGPGTAHVLVRRNAVAPASATAPAPQPGGLTPGLTPHSKMSLTLLPGRCRAGQPQTCGRDSGSAPVRVGSPCTPLAE